MKVKKVTENGKVTILVDGKEKGHELSRELTGTTNELDSGIFVHLKGETNFRYGDYTTDIVFPTGLETTLPVREYASRLAERVNKVRSWVAACQSGDGEVDILDKVEVAARGLETHQLLWRKEDGTLVDL